VKRGREAEKDKERKAEGTRDSRLKGAYSLAEGRKRRECAGCRRDDEGRSRRRRRRKRRRKK